MKCLSLLALCLAAAACNSTGSVEWVDYGGDTMQNPQYMTDMMAAGTPGAEHAALASLVGSWKVEGMIGYRWRGWDVGWNVQAGYRAMRLLRLKLERGRLTGDLRGPVVALSVEF